MPHTKEDHPEFEKISGLDAFITTFIEESDTWILPYLEKLQTQKKPMSPHKLARLVVRRKAQKNGLVGCITSLGGFAAFPITIPTDLVLSWKIQIGLILTIAKIYGHTAQTTDLKTDIYLVMIGNSTKELFTQLGIEASKAVSKKVLGKYISKEITQELWKIMGRTIIVRAGEKSLISFIKFIPFIAAPVGFVFDWKMTTTVGKNAIKYYR